MLLSLFCLPKKVTKKGHPNPITSRLWEGSLIWLLCYCGLYFGNATRRRSRHNLIKAPFILMNTHI